MFYAVDKAFDELLNAPVFHLPKNAFHGGAERGGFVPSADIVEKENGFLVTLDVPGLNKEDITIEVEDNRLLVSGERKSEENAEASRYTERKFGKFQRAFRLPNGVDFAKIQASVSNGVLEIALPKSEAIKPRKIAIVDSTPTHAA